LGIDRQIGLVVLVEKFDLVVSVSEARRLFAPSQFETGFLSAAISP